MFANHRGGDTAVLVEGLRRDGNHALAGFFRGQHAQLYRFVSSRMDNRLAGRVGADDVLQEAFVEAAKRLDRYLEKMDLPPALWLQMIVGQTMINVHRRHLGTKKRDASREVGLGEPTDTSPHLTREPAVYRPAASPEHAAIQIEQREQLNRALDRLSELDRRVVSLRHFAELSNADIAMLLGISQKAASIRYHRAIAKLRRLVPSGFRPEA